MAKRGIIRTAGAVQEIIVGSYPNNELTGFLAVEIAAKKNNQEISAEVLQEWLGYGLFIVKKSKQKGKLEQLTPEKFLARILKFYDDE